MTKPLPELDQQPMTGVNRAVWDVTVVGAGPAGGAAATRLAGQGVSVLLADRSRFPREKVCGDGLVPEAMAALAQIGLADEVRSHGMTLPGYRLVAPSGRAVDLDAPVTVLSRQALDTLLAVRAVNNGATFVYANFEGAKTLPDGDVECTLDGKVVRCRILILAPGADVTSLRTAGITTPFQKPEGVAIRRYYRSSKGPERACFYLHESFLPGYAWIFPMGDGYYNVGCGRFLTTPKKFDTSLVAAFETFLAEEPVARELVASATETTPVRGSSLRCAMQGFDQAQQGRILLVGEAIGTTIPGWGEGISKAMETGLLAAEVSAKALCMKDFSLLKDYPRRLAEEIRPDIERHTRVTRFFNRPWTANLLVALARAMPKKWI